MRNAHCRTWNMARKLKIMENENYTLGHEIWQGNLKRVENLEMYTCRTWNMVRKLKIMENEKHPLDDLKNDEIPKKREKIKNAH